MTVVIKNFLDKQFIPELISFIKKNHGSNHVMTNKIMLDYFFWDKKNTHYNLIVAFAQNILVGILGYIPTTFRWDTEKKQEIVGVWTSHWTVNMKYRNGIGVLLMRRLQELYPIVAGQGANNLNKKIVTKMGHHFLDHMTRTVKVYNWPYLTNVFPNLDLTELIPLKKPINRVGKKNINFVPIEFKPTVSNYQPDWKFYKNYNNGTKKSFDFIKSKYIDHPVFKYEFLLSGKKNHPCLLIFRLEKTSGRAKFNCIRITDLIVPDLEDSFILLKNIFKKLNTFALKNKVIFADFFCTNENLHKQIRAFGFIQEITHNLPNLLNPIIDKARNQNIEIFLSNKKMPPWQETYFTKSDGDQDRPNLNNLLDYNKRN